ncbi:MAG: FliM/FliN family flagellar motor switch protein [Phycisphaerales bacterium]|nr:FliM/FliN family flagellar motor switch protein [Phycisphaerales bacterium]
MHAPHDATRSLPIPVTVRIASKATRLQEILRLQPGSIIELPKRADEELDVMINSAVIAKGRAVKVGENFGVEITSYRGLASS